MIMLILRLAGHDCAQDVVCTQCRMYTKSQHKHSTNVTLNEEAQVFSTDWTYMLFVQQLKAIDATADVQHFAGDLPCSLVEPLRPLWPTFHKQSLPQRFPKMSLHALAPFLFFM